MLSASLNKTFLSLSRTSRYNNFIISNCHTCKHFSDSFSVLLKNVCTITASLKTFKSKMTFVARREREREMFYLTTQSTHFIYSYMASDICLRTILIVRKETRCRLIGYSYRLAARVLLYAPSHRQDSTHHGLCYTSRGALAGTRKRQWVHPMKDRSDDPSHHE